MKKGCHFVVIPRPKQPKNNPNNDSLLLANYLILNNSVVETAGIEPTANSILFRYLEAFAVKMQKNINWLPKSENSRCYQNVIIREMMLTTTL